MLWNMSFSANRSWQAQSAGIITRGSFETTISECNHCYKERRIQGCAELSGVAGYRGVGYR
jgi:hypothetical protein